jgi:uncharacterized membrane protein HdeD (DUF308 family)
MLATNTQNWWAIALQSVIAILFGILTLVWPVLTILTLVTLFGAFSLIDGVTAAFTGITAPTRKEPWWGKPVSGVAGILICLFILLQPGLSTIVLPHYVAAWVALTGILGIMAGTQLRRASSGEWVMILTGILSVVFAFLTILFPRADALSLLWLLGTYSISFGFLILVLTFRMRGTLTASSVRGPRKIHRTSRIWLLHTESGLQR